MHHTNASDCTVSTQSSLLSSNVTTSPPSLVHKFPIQSPGPEHMVTFGTQAYTQQPVLPILFLTKITCTLLHLLSLVSSLRCQYLAPVDSGSEEMHLLPSNTFMCLKLTGMHHNEILPDEHPHFKQWCH